MNGKDIANALRPSFWWATTVVGIYLWASMTFMLFALNYDQLFGLEWTPELAVIYGAIMFSNALAAYRRFQSWQALDTFSNLLMEQYINDQIKEKEEKGD